MDFSALYLLRGIVQHYSWGGYEFIPRLLREKAQLDRPYAEYWLGAHPNHPALLQPGNIPLDQYISSHSQVLGSYVSETFNTLPYLLKVLDVREMLSIQVHPDKNGARKGYDEEENRGMARNASDRNYKDVNHKPELMVALGDFWLLHGFLEQVSILKVLDGVQELRFLKEVFESGGYQSLISRVMNMEEDDLISIQSSLSERLLPLYLQGKLLKSDPGYWVARAINNLSIQKKYDRGLLWIYFMNLVYLKKDEGIFQPAGLPHAYLEGQNVEVMANSDNVLRAGLTDKHIDVKELMKHIRFVATKPQIISPALAEEMTYSTPAEEFELSKIELKDKKRFVCKTRSAEIMLCIQGSAELKTSQQKLTLEQGDSIFIPAGLLIEMEGKEDAAIYRTKVPVV